LKHDQKLDRLESEIRALEARLKGGTYPDEWRDPVTFFRAVSGFEADSWQAGVLASDSKRIVMLAARQLGKSQVAAVVALHTALLTDRALVLLLSPSLRQSQELFHRVLDCLRTIEARVPIEAESALRIEFPNRSRIIALPGTERTARGFAAVNLLIVDEAARVEDPVFFGLRPVLAVSDGRLMLLSTGFGRRGFFYETFENGGPDWYRVKVRGADCLRISAAFLAEQRRTMPVWFYNSEWECMFEDDESLAVFSSDDIWRAMHGETTESWDAILGSINDPATERAKDERGSERWEL
jgi:hypothetical protein